jgi:hypothetical protein
MYVFLKIDGYQLKPEDISHSFYIPYRSRVGARGGAVG